MTNPLPHNEFNKLAKIFEEQKQRALDKNWPRYQIFGLNMASDYAFGDRLPQGQGDSDIFFSCQSSAPISVDWDEVEPVYTSIYRTKDDKPFRRLYKIEEYYVARHTDAANFYMIEDAILCHILDKARPDAYVMNILPTILAFWLEFQGVPCLHGSAVVVDDRAVVFLADSGQGKSTLAASFLQAGYSLLTDDKLPVEQKGGIFWGRPGFPLMRMYPEVAEHLDVDCQDWDLVMPGFTKRVAHVEHRAIGRFFPTSVPLAGIYILERIDVEASEQQMAITPVSTREAAIELIRYDFTSRVNAALGFSANRLNFFSRLAQHVPVNQLAYPTGYAYLPKVCEDILTDIEQYAHVGNYKKRIV